MSEVAIIGRTGRPLEVTPATTPVNTPSCTHLTMTIVLGLVQGKIGLFSYILMLMQKDGLTHK